MQTNKQITFWIITGISVIITIGTFLVNVIAESINNNLYDDCLEQYEVCK